MVPVISDSCSGRSGGSGGSGGFVPVVSFRLFRVLVHAFPASGKTLAERLRVLAASCEELRARTGNPPLRKQKYRFEQKHRKLKLKRDQYKRKASRPI